MAVRASSLFVLYAFVSHTTLVNAASFARFFLRDITNSPTVDFQEQNGLAAQQLNAQFTSLTASNPCKDGSIACVNDAFAQCTGGKWALTRCPNGLSCYALPLVNSPGTSIACDTEQDALSRINASGASGGVTGTSGNSTGSTPPSSASSIPTSSIPASATSTSTLSTPTTGTTGGQTSQHGNDSGDEDCGDNEMGSTTSHGNSGDTGADDCDDDTSSNHHQGGSSIHSADSSGDDCDGDDGTGGTEPDGNDVDCDDGISSSAPATTASASQLYRRQLDFITDAGETTLAIPTQTAEPSVTTPIAATTVSNSSLFDPSQTGITPSSSVPPLVPTTFSSNTGINTSPGASTVTLTLVSTITVAASGCQPDSTGLPSNSATLPTSSIPGSPVFPTTFPSPFPSASNTHAPGNTFTSAPVSSTPSASGPLGNTFTTPTASSSAPLGTGGIFFTTK